MFQVGVTEDPTEECEGGDILVGTGSENPKGVNLSSLSGCQVVVMVVDTFAQQ